MTGNADLTRLVPGFDFLQGLMKNASAGIPAMGQWIAPTLDPEELDKRIQELKTVHFWLEQNARLLATTIQALEVQRMTLSTLKTMNLPLADLSESLKIRTPAKPARAPAAAAADAPAAAATKAAAPAVDPLQWWGALTQQFTEIAAKAVKEGANQAAGLPGAGPLAAAMGQLAEGARQAAGKAGTSAKAASPARATKTTRGAATARRKA